MPIAGRWASSAALTPASPATAASFMPHQGIHAPSEPASPSPRLPRALCSSAALTPSRKEEKLHLIRKFCWAGFLFHFHQNPLALEHETQVNQKYSKPLKKKKAFQTGSFRFSLIIQRLCNPFHPCFNRGQSGKVLQKQQLCALCRNGRRQLALASAVI